MHPGQPVNHDSAADQEHRGGPDDREHAHQARRGRQQPGAEAPLQPCRQIVAGALLEIDSGVIQFDDARYEPVDADGHQQSNPRKDRELVDQ